MFRVLGAPGNYNNGRKCDVIEFENPLNSKQELAFLCYCNPMELRSKCNIVNYNNAAFNNMFSNQVVNAY